MNFHPCHRWLWSISHVAEIYIWCAWQFDWLPMQLTWKIQNWKRSKTERSQFPLVWWWYTVQTEKIFSCPNSPKIFFVRFQPSCHWISSLMPGAQLCYLFDSRCFPSLAMQVHGRCSRSLYMYLYMLYIIYIELQVIELWFEQAFWVKTSAWIMALPSLDPDVVPIHAPYVTAFEKFPRLKEVAWTKHEIRSNHPINSDEKEHMKKACSIISPWFFHEKICQSRA